MNSYYNETLYPIQDKILQLPQLTSSDFYLTGGTALSRHYYHHRFSDDLDFFVNNQENFFLDTQKLINSIKEVSVRIETQSPDYFSVTVEDQLKVDFVNDVGKRIGQPFDSELFTKTDTWENILANKITALIGRDDPKDVVDIWMIASQQTIDWPFFFEAANSKAVGIFPPMIAQKIETFPLNLLKRINWIPDKKPNQHTFQSDLKKIADQILQG